MSETTRNPQTRASNYLCESQQRLLFVIGALAGHEVDGVSLTEISSALAARTGKSKNAQKNNVFRDLHNLAEAGFAEQMVDTDRWRLAPKFMQIALSHQRHLERVSARLDETRQRFSRDHS